jgi:hypothetical protein
LGGSGPMSLAWGLHRLGFNRVRRP